MVTRIRLKHPEYIDTSGNTFMYVATTIGYIPFATRPIQFKGWLDRHACTRK